MYDIDDATIDRLANEPWYVSTRASQRDRYRRCLDMLAKHNVLPELAYDIGCANGQFSAQLAKIADKVIAVDINEERIAQNQSAYKQLTNLKFMAGNFMEFAGEEQAQLVTALEILYYFSPREQEDFLAKVADLVYSDGYLLVSANVFFAGHFSESSFLQLIAKYFTVVDTYTVYRNLYYRLELPVIRFLDEINYLVKLRLFSPNILSVPKKFYPGIWNRLLLQPSVILDKVILPLARSVGMQVLKSKRLYQSITALSRWFAPNKSRSQIIILARAKS